MEDWGTRGNLTTSTSTGNRPRERIRGSPPPGVTPHLYTTEAATTGNRPREKIRESPLRVQRDITSREDNGSNHSHHQDPGKLPGTDREIHPRVHQDVTSREGNRNDQSHHQDHGNRPDINRESPPRGNNNKQGQHHLHMPNKGNRPRTRDNLPVIKNRD